MTEKTATPWRIPTREEHDRFIRLIWKLCLFGAGLVFLTSGGTVLVMWALNYESKTIVNVTTIVFQIVLLPYGLGYVAPTLATSLIKMALGVEMSRRGLEIGQETSDNLAKLTKKIEPMIEKGDRVLVKLEPMVEKADAIIDEFRKNDFGKVHKVLERLEGEMNGGGKVERLVNAVERLAKKADEKAGDALEDLLAEAWTEDPAKGPSGVDTPPNAG